ncbi:type IV conjugative transfer system lipoprotein TraV [Acinetobacter baumannii]|uniref:type IV conjugative transfer system lipoprotein TraV n=1 Tax=Acinetobacter TaxID=469 RepID=UPI00259D65A2|nr:type IV conjugative transfer system lipoprotein TraV [Acinetobacter variabilis]EKV2617721.1 type IV conjugative transfer system lipoprotein TraV [Acinetobacter baumannii]
MRNKLIALSIISIGLSGCNTLDGLNSKSNFDCKAPDGVVCDSMTGVMANAKANNLPGQQVKRTVAKTPVKGSVYATQSRADRVLTTMEYTGAPILRNPKTLRIWVAPWEGADRTLYDQQFFYIVVDNWKWNIEHNSRRVRQAYAPNAASSYVAAPMNRGSSSQDSYSYRIEGNTAVRDDEAVPVSTSNVGTIDPLAGDKGNIDEGITKELQNMNLDISQFTKPLANSR